MSKMVVTHSYGGKTVEDDIDRLEIADAIITEALTKLNELPDSFIKGHGDDLHAKAAFKQYWRGRATLSRVGAFLHKSADEARRAVDRGAATEEALTKAKEWAAPILKRSL